MILAVAWSRLMNLRRDRAAFVLAFVLPVAFFSIFAGIFAGSGRSTTRKVDLVVVDEDQSPGSQRFVAGLQAEAGLSVALKPSDKNAEEHPAGPLYTAATAEQAVRRGDVAVALVIPKGFGERPLAFGPGKERIALRLLSDSSDPIAPQIVFGLVQKVAMTAMPASLARTGMDEVDRWSGGLTPEQKERMETMLGALDRESAPTRANPAATPSGEKSGGLGGGIVAVDVRDIVGEKKRNPTVTFYAAGLGVMFLLFSATGAGGALIEEAESGTLDRILATRVSMTRLLLGKLVYLAGVGIVQLLLMFTWGALLFGIELFTPQHFPGFLIMTVATAIAASTFGLMLASVCRSRMQLVAVANLSILVMSALGGSLYPRFLMPAGMQKFGLVTINAWALDGFQKIFWRDEPLWTLWPQVLVLTGLGVLFFLIARRVARRWEFA
ncbi:MAG TPA: ABC transporter permease [Thermoanaerobaculia bacterium]|jgi:ABC-2 type transport system permease protein